jgi:hypothetical protein
MRTSRSILPGRTWLVGVVLLAACPAPYSVWLVDGSTAGDLTFGVATKRGGTQVNPLLRVLLTTCSGFTGDLRRLPVDTVWLSRSEAEFPRGPRVDRLAYGKPIPEHHDSVPSRALNPGCYHMSVDAYPGSAALRFIIEPDGTARELTEPERDSVADTYAGHRLLERDADRQADETCRNGYQAASSVSDTIAVDSMVPYDTTRFSPLTCAMLRQLKPDSTRSNRDTRGA